MKLSRAVQDYLDDCRLKRRSPATLVTYGNALGFLVRLAMLHNRDEVGTCTPSLVREYFAIASERENQTETLLKKRSVLRGFTRWGLHRRLWLADPMADAPEYRKPGRLPRPFERRERDGLMALPLDSEERALRAVLYYSGLRVGEVVRLRARDVLFGDGIRPGRLLVRGKGDRDRAVPMMPELEVALGDYLMDRSEANRFVFTHRNGPWTARMIRYRVARWGRAAGVDQCIPHRWRHTSATELFEAGADPRSAQRFMGHKSLSTTMLYTQVADAEVERAVLQRSAMLRRRAEVLRQDSIPQAEGAAEGRVE